MESREILMEYAKSIIAALVLALLIITFVVQAFYIPSGSMRPTLAVGDRVIVNKFIYRFKNPERFNIIVFKYPVDPRRKFIKRLIGVGGDKIEIINGTVYVNDKALKEDYTLTPGIGNYGPTVVPKDNYFVLGDNRNNSEDSRYWGFVPRKNIVGQAIFVFWPINHINVLTKR